MSIMSCLLISINAVYTIIVWCAWPSPILYLGLHLVIELNYISSSVTLDCCVVPLGHVNPVQLLLPPYLSCAPKVTYTLSVDTVLSRSSYQYTLPSVELKSFRGMRHFLLSFSPKVNWLCIGLYKDILLMKWHCIFC